MSIANIISNSAMKSDVIEVDKDTPMLFTGPQDSLNRPECSEACLDRGPYSLGTWFNEKGAWEIIQVYGYNCRHTLMPEGLDLDNMPDASKVIESVEWEAQETAAQYIDKIVNEFSDSFGKSLKQAKIERDSKLATAVDLQSQKMFIEEKIYDITRKYKDELPTNIKERVADLTNELDKVKIKINKVRVFDISIEF